jgi:hypothetical protein
LKNCAKLKINSPPESIIFDCPEQCKSSFANIVLNQQQGFSDFGSVNHFNNFICKNDLNVKFSMCLNKYHAMKI